MQSKVLGDTGIRYLTDEAGARIGVILDLATFERLIEDGDAELLHGLSEGELAALAAGILAPVEQDRLLELVEQQAIEGQSRVNIEALDALLGKIEHLNILKARATYTLQRTGAAE